MKQRDLGMTTSVATPPERACAGDAPGKEAPLTPRIAIFTHDTFGLGHVRRCLHLVRSVARRAPEAAILLITGSPAVRVIDDLPGNADFVKIPTVAKTGARHERPPHVPLPLASVSMLRREMIQHLVVSFAPDVFLVDNFPLGSGDELLATLHQLRRGSTRTVLGLRDIVDTPETVREDWRREGTYDVLDRYYDRILVYGMREVLDVAEAYALPRTISSKIRYCGYVAEDFSKRALEEHPARELGITKPFLLATAGGGGDGFPLLNALVGALHRIADLPAVIVTGPLMSAADRKRLSSAIGDRPETVLVDYVRDLPSYLAAARLVVAMGGYNTAAEIAALGVRAVLVPRTWRYGEHRKRAEVRAEGEQMLRAEALSRLGLVDVLDPEALTPEAVAASVERSLTKSASASPARLDLGGGERVASELLTLAGAAGD